MKPTSLQQIALWCNGTVSAEHKQITVNGLCNDSRELVSGELFFALEGAHDGHDYVGRALEAGAAAAVVSHPVEQSIPQVLVEDTKKALADIARAYKDSLKIRTVAITGSVGKTTTRALTMTLLSRVYRTCGTIRNYNNDIGLPVTIGKVNTDTEMLVLEMGMNHFGEMRYLSNIGHPDLVAITNIGSMHIENLGSREGILKAKLEILDGMHRGGVCFYNGDEALLWDLRETNPYRTLYFGIDNDACDIRATDVRLLEGKSRFRVQWENYDFPVELPLGGKHNIYNALAAIAIALHEKVPVEEIQKGLDGFINTEQRQQVLYHKTFTIIDDTYNAGPESMEAALMVLRSTSGMGENPRRIAVLGDMLELGNHASGEHHRIGRMAACNADLLLTYGPLSVHMVSGAITGGMSQRSAMNFQTQEELVNTLKNRAKPGDVLLFKGSHGMHMEKVLQAFIEET